MERRKFTREFKLEAVRLIKDRGVSYVQASHRALQSASRMPAALRRKIVYHDDILAHEGRGQTLFDIGQELGSGH